MENKKLVYLDKNIFSILKNECKSSNMEKFNNIMKSKCNFLYVYSGAHIFDLQNDFTDEKYKDLDFIKKITDDNYIYFDFYTNKFVLNNMDIKECFENTINFNSIYENLDFTNLKESLFNIFPKINDKEILEILNNYLDYLQAVLNIEIPIIDYLKNTPKELLDLMSNSLKEKEYISIAELTSIFINEVNNDINDDKLYRDKRRKIKNYFYNISEEEQKKYLNDMNKSIQNQNISTFAKSFGEYISSDIFYNGLSEKKVKYRNMNIDAQHANFAEVVDYFVTNDDGLFKKSKTLHKNANILKLEEFIKLINI